MGAAAVLILVLAAAYTVFIKPKSEEETVVYKEEQAAYGDLTQGIMESGSITLRTTDQSYDVVIDDEEEDEDDDDDDDDDEEDTRHLKVEEVYVKQGERIRAGEPVLKVTERSIRLVRRYLETERSDAEIALEELQNEYEIEQVEAGNTYQKSMADALWSDTQYAIDTAQIPLEIAALRDSIAVLEQEIAQTEKDLEDSWDDYADLKEEYEKYARRYEEWDKDNLYTYIPLRTQYLSAKEKYEEETERRLDQREEMADKQEEILEKQEELARLEGQTERKELEARQSHESSALDGAMAQDIYDSSLNTLEQNQETAQKDLDELSERLEDFNAFVGEDGIVYAQGDGLVTRVYYEAGDILEEESPMITYVEEGSYVMTIDIAQEDIPYVSVGDTVTIVFTAYPEESWTGKIEEIVSTQTSEDTVTVSYPVTVKVEGDTSALYGGMTGEVTFITDEVSKAVYVSRKAVISENGKSYVLMKDDTGELVRREVETGFTDGAHIQILSGLVEGDTVYIESHVRNQEEKDAEETKTETPEDGSKEQNESGGQNGSEEQGRSSGQSGSQNQGENGGQDGGGAMTQQGGLNGTKER